MEGRWWGGHWGARWRRPRLWAPRHGDGAPAPMRELQQLPDRGRGGGAWRVRAIASLPFPNARQRRQWAIASLPFPDRSWMGGSSVGGAWGHRCEAWLKGTGRRSQLMLWFRVLKFSCYGCANASLGAQCCDVIRKNCLKRALRNLFQAWHIRTEEYHFIFWNLTRDVSAPVHFFKTNVYIWVNHG